MTLHKFTFVDLFAGIGGFHLAMKSVGGECVFASEIDKFARHTYKINHGMEPFGDISAAETRAAIPAEFDVLCAGFPCQPFSTMGARKGFEDARGTLFFHIADIIKTHKPKAFILENVKGLKSIDGGAAFRKILEILRDELGYHVPEPEILNAKHFGLAQHRERLIFVGFRKDVYAGGFEYPKTNGKAATFGDVRERGITEVAYYISEHCWQAEKKKLEEHQKRYNSKGFCYTIVNDEGITRTLLAGCSNLTAYLVHDVGPSDYTPTTNIRGGKVNGDGIRALTEREFARLQGFSDSFRIEVSRTQAYKQFGNAVPVPMIAAVAEGVLSSLK